LLARSHLDGLWNDATQGKDATAGMTFAGGQVCVLPKKLDEKVARPS
jgi:hypothetical protein